MKRERAERYWQIACALVRLARKNGAWPCSLEIAKAIGVGQRQVFTLLRGMRDEELVERVGSVGSNDCGWMPTSETLRWTGLERPALKVDVPRHEIRRNPYKLRAHRKLERLRSRMVASEVLDGAEVFES